MKDPEIGSDIPASGDSTANIIANMAHCQWKMKKYRDAYQQIMRIITSYENGNPTGLNKSFMVYCYNFSACCLVKIGKE